MLVVFEWAESIQLYPKTWKSNVGDVASANAMSANLQLFGIARCAQNVMPQRRALLWM